MIYYRWEDRIEFVKNENWYGYTDGNHVYVDPEDGLTYPMYQTNKIDARYIWWNNDAKEAFQKGELAQYGLSAEDHDSLSGSKYCYFTPDGSSYSLILGGNLSALQKRESDYDFEIELYTSHISQLENQLIQLDNIRNSLSDDAVAIASLNFDAGRIRFTTEHQGVTFPDGLLKEASNRHLTYFDKEVIAIANYCINGDLVSQILGDNISPDMGTMLGIGRNEFGIGLQIALDALSTMNGDLTIALNSIDGEVSQRYSRYNQHSYEHLDINSLNALLITDVSDRYIIDNITRIGGDFFIRNSDGALTMSLNNKLKLYLGQQDNTLYAGINEYPILSSKPATEANWYYDIEGSVGYTVVNINALLNSNYIDLAYNNWLNSLPSLDAELIRKACQDLSAVSICQTFIKTTEDREGINICHWLSLFYKRRLHAYFSENFMQSHQ
jgi:hypothetical protein